jgi:hypothetical protein
MAGLGIHISIQRFARANGKPPISQLNLRNLGLTSAEIDERLDYLSGAGISHTEIDLRGNSNPTAASADARQTLGDNYVLVTYNKGFS